MSLDKRGCTQTIKGYVTTKLFVSEDAVPATGAEVPGAPGGRAGPGGAALSAARAHTPQVQYRAYPRTLHVSFFFFFFK